jgi:TRAP-type mannitol/chloroaromatic compound transport system substrate-binding protein
VDGTKSLRRRRFIKLAAVGAAGATVAGCKPQEHSGPAVHTGDRVQWRLVSSFPRGLDTLYGSSELLAKRLEALSGGRFRIRPHPAGEIVPGLQVLDAVQQGTVQVGHTASYYFTGKNPALAFDAGVPFGLTARQQFAWLYHGGGSELMQDLFADFNVVSFPAGSTGVQMGGWFKREVSTLADLQGLKMRIPGLGGEVMQRLGATVQVLAGGDIYPALERGAIDATEWVGPYDDEKLGFHRIADNYYYPGWWEPGPTLSFYVNQRDWDGLPAEYKEMFETAATEVSMRMTAQYDTLNPPAMMRLLGEGVQLRRFSDEIMEAARTASFELYEEQATADPTYRKIYDAWSSARGELYRWFGTAEAGYASFAFARPDPG